MTADQVSNRYAHPQTADLTDPAYRPNLWRLALAQLLSGVGIASGVAVGAVLVERVSGSTTLAGLAQTHTVLGAAVVAFPLARLSQKFGRRTALSLGFLVGSLGAVLVLAGVQLNFLPLLLLALFIFGAATATGLQSRYAATDLSPTHLRARSMSIVVWATTIGSVAGPNLSAPADRLGAVLGLRPLAGPYLFSVAAFALAALVTWSMRNPAHNAQTITHRRLGILASLKLIAAHPAARLGFASVVTGQMMMASVMVMTPLHMFHHDLSLNLVGLVISGHILGMYGFSPIIGWAVDKVGGRWVILAGMVILALSFALGVWEAESAQPSMPRLTVALLLLGIGWSCTLIAGSNMVTNAVEPDVKMSVQGATDTVMGLGSALVAGASGVILGWGGFTAVNLVAAAILIPLLIALVQSRR